MTTSSSPFRRLVFMVADRGLHRQQHLVDLPQVTEVNAHVSEGLLAKLAAEGAARPDLRVVELHVGAEAAGVGVGFAADRTDVRPSVGVAVHVALQVVLKLETAAAGGAAVDRATTHEHSGVTGASQVEGFLDGWGTVQDLGGDRGRELVAEHELLFLHIRGGGLQTHQLRNRLH